MVAEDQGGNNNVQVCDFLKGEPTRTFVLLIEGEPLEIGSADPGQWYATGNPPKKRERQKERKLIGHIESFYRVGR